MIDRDMLMRAKHKDLLRLAEHLGLTRIAWFYAKPSPNNHLELAGAVMEEIWQDEIAKLWTEEDDQ